MMNSIRGRLIIRIGLGFLLLILFSGILLYWQVHRSLLNTFDQVVLSRVETILQVTEINEEGLFEFDFQDFATSRQSMEKNRIFFELWSPDSDLIVKFPEGETGDLPPPSFDRETPYFFNHTLESGIRGRGVFLRFFPREETAKDSTSISPPRMYSIAALLPRTELDQTLSSILESLITTGCLSLIILIPLIWWGVRSGLKFLNRVGLEIESLDAGNLEQRLSIRHCPVELKPVVSKFNELLDRLEIAFARERRFTADAAHELRTPVAELRTMTEVGLEEFSDSQGNIISYLNDFHQLSLQMESLVNSLLSLALGEQVVNQLQELDLVKLSRELIKKCSVNVVRKGIVFHLDSNNDISISSNRELLEPMLNNLLSNAITYSIPGSKVDLSIFIEQDRVIWKLTNLTRDLDRTDLPHFFEPFWRKDKARSSAKHFGLGLTLVNRYAEVLGMTIQTELTDSDPSRFCISLSFPSSIRD